MPYDDDEEKRRRKPGSVASALKGAGEMAGDAYAAVAGLADKSPAQHLASLGGSLEGRTRRTTPTPRQVGEDRGLITNPAAGVSMDESQAEASENAALAESLRGQPGEAGPELAGAGMKTGAGLPPEAGAPMLDALDQKFGNITRKYNAKAQQAMTAFDEASSDLMKTQGELDTLSQEELEEKAGVIKEKRGVMDKIFADQAQREQISRRGIKKLETKYETASNIANSMQVDPGRLMSSTTNKVVALLSMALEGLGQAWAGKDINLQSIDLINNAINRDIELQQQGIDRQRQIANDYLQQIGMEKEDLLTEAQMSEFNMMKTNERYASVLDDIATKHEGTRLGIIAKQVAAQKRSELATQMAAMAQNAAQTELAGAQAQANIEFQKAQLAQGRQKAQAQAGIEEGKRRVVGMEHSGEVIPSPKEVERIRTKRGTAVYTHGKIQELTKILEEEGAMSPGTDAYADAQALLTAIDMQMKNIEELGVLAGEDLNLIKKMTGDAGSVLGSGLTDADIVRLKRTQSNIGDRFLTDAAQLGYMNDRYFQTSEGYKGAKADIEKQKLKFAGK